MLRRRDMGIRPTTERVTKSCAVAPAGAQPLRRTYPAYPRVPYRATQVDQKSQARYASLRRPPNPFTPAHRCRAPWAATAGRIALLV